MQSFSGNQRPDLLTFLINMLFVLRLPRKMYLYRSFLNVPYLPSFLEMRRNPYISLTFDKVHNPLCVPHETSSECPKVVRTWCVSYILISKYASRHNGVYFFDISISKSCPKLVYFIYLDFENVLRATTACIFSTSQFLKIIRN